MYSTLFHTSRPIDWHTPHRQDPPTSNQMKQIDEHAEVNSEGRLMTLLLRLLATSFYGLAVLVHVESNSARKMIVITPDRVTLQLVLELSACGEISTIRVQFSQGLQSS